jgi:ubiquinol-cytochrome c reductase cytochrome c1 subunit
MKTMTRALVVLLAGMLMAGTALAEEEGYRLDRAPIDPRDLASLQSGARTFANYCLSCHSARYMRYNRLEDLGLTREEIEDNLMFATDKIGETMTVAMTAANGKKWFGVAPPDLTVIARYRGADWLYTYLRTFYRDPKTSSGWNNAVFPNVAMPNVLWTLQGQRALDVVKGEEEGHETTEYKWRQLTPGEQDQVQYDTTVRDLVNYLVYMGEPAAIERKRIGILVLFVLGILFIFAYLLKKAYWKDVK